MECTKGVQKVRGKVQSCPYFINQLILTRTVHFYKKSMKSHLIVYRAIFTKLCISKVQYVGGKQMTSHMCVASLRHEVIILFSEYA